MAQKLITQRVDLQGQNGENALMWPDVLAVKGESNAHLWRVTVLDGGAAADLTGHAAQCYAVNGADNSVLFTAAVEGNIVSAVLPDACYVSAGSLKCCMSVSTDEAQPVIALLMLHVRDGMTDVIIDPEDLIPSYTEMQEMMAALAGAAEAEAARVTAESGRDAAESAREASEADRVTAELARAAADTLRDAAEGLRASAEADRLTAESGRAAAESARSAAEADRGTAELSRAAAESARSTAETDRQTAESGRAADEGARGNAEALRASAETGRVTAEGAREAAETQRATTSAAATEAANTAAAKIDGMTVETSVVPYGTTPVATVTEVDGHKHVAIQTQQGPQGPGYTIKGAAYTTLAELEAAVPNPEEGDQYNVGAAAPYHVYRWTGGVWEDQGTVEGPQGDPGQGVPTGGAAGTMLQKVSGDDFNTRWATVAQVLEALGLMVNGLVKGDGAGGFAAAAAGTDYRKPRTLLWSGSWSSGAITVPGISDYTRIEVVISIYCLYGTYTGSYIRAGTVTGVGSTSNATIATLAASVNGDTITMQQCYVGGLTTTPSYSPDPATVTAIYGLD